MSESDVEVVISGDMSSRKSEMIEDELAELLDSLRLFDQRGMVRSEVTGNEVSFNVEGGDK